MLLFILPAGDTQLFDQRHCTEPGFFLNFADGSLRGRLAGLDRAFGHLQAGFFQAVKDEQLRAGLVRANDGGKGFLLEKPK
jgi:sigma54-dependent transcription regulator